MNQMLKSSLLLFVGCFTLVACGGKEENKKESNLTINVASVEKKTMSQKQEFSFISKPFRSSILSFRVGGPIVNFDTYVGSYYTEGGVIAEIDPRDFIIRKEQSETKFIQSKSDYERIKSLYQKDNVSVNTYEKSKVEYTNAKTTHETRCNELDDTKLIAPFSGYIGELFIEKHQEAKPTQPIVSLNDISKLKIEFYVTQEFAFKAQNLEYVNLYFDALPNKMYRAKLIETSKSTTSNNISYLFTAILENPDDKLLAGMSGKVVLDISDANDKNIIIPQAALCHNLNDKDYVWVVDKESKKVSKRGVELDRVLTNGRASIKNGLQEGELVATSGLRFLSDKMSVKIAKK